MSDNSLPDPFQDLEPFVDEWALSTAVERNRKRTGSMMEELVRFYEAMQPRWEAVVNHCQTISVDSLSAEEKRLIKLSFAYMEVSNAVERFGEPAVPYSLDPAVMVSIHDGNDAYVA